MGNIQGLVLVFFMVALVGCSDPTIDASSDESIKQSVEKVRESLPESRRAKFDEAMQILAFNQISLTDIFAEGVTGAGNIEGKVRQSLDGKTGEQVIAEAERIEAERKERERQQAAEAARIEAERKEHERQQALEEIKELKAKRARSASAQEKLKKFQVIRSRFYIREREFMGEQPVIELTVKNGTEKAVSRAYFKGTLASPDRSVPWHQDTFNYNISGGLEPGEQATWNLAPNMFSEWGKVDAPSDAVFTVTVERLDGPDGEPIYSIREFGERDRDRLDELKKKYSLQ